MRSLILFLAALAFFVVFLSAVTSAIGNGRIFGLGLDVSAWLTGLLFLAAVGLCALLLCSPKSRPAGAVMLIFIVLMAMDFFVG
jgi:hypothetical protein